ncbi:MAG: chorismate mutase, partial [Planctomycetes bacterium]|nr:chorismate mutase [Planctomycetota bacterium]
MGIEQLRAEIDRLDAELMQLLARRAELSLAVHDAKQAAGLPPRDAAREAAILAGARAAARPPLTQEGAEAVM